MRHASQNETILAGFLPWVETQSGEYDFMANRGCAFGRYLQALGYEDPHVEGWHYRVSAGAEYAPLGRLSQPIVAQPWTYEALAERLRQCAKPVSEERIE